MKLDKNDAPKGAIAVEASPDCVLCTGCMYFVHGNCTIPINSARCSSATRRDGHDVIFKPRPKAKRDSRGRFTSEQSEKRKTMNKEYMEKHFPAYTEAQKAMKDETITQTLGKKQAGIESKQGQNYGEYQGAKRVQVNVEKYGDEPTEIALDKCYNATGNALPSVRAFLQWLNQPAEQDWPSWCKVGKWVAWSFKDGPTEFYKIDRTANGVMYSGGMAITKEGIEYYKPARVRPFTAKEAVDLWHKTIVDKSGKHLVYGVELTRAGDVFVYYDKWSANDLDNLAKHYTFEDGSPCGVLEVVK